MNLLKIQVPSVWMQRCFILISLATIGVCVFCATASVVALFDCYDYKEEKEMEDFWYIWLLPAIGGLIWYVISMAAVKAPGNALQSKFVKLGTLKGKKLDEIIAVCGYPSSVSSSNGGVKIYQWMATGYHVVLLFDENDICLGVSSETKV